MAREIAGGQLSFNAQYHYQTRTLYGGQYLPAYGNADARVTLAGAFGQPIDLSLFATNLFNETYAIGGGSVAPGIGFYSFIFAPPRMVGGSIRYRFDAR